MDGNRQNVIIAGLDEAGYGPVLGPLVVSSAAIELSKDSAGSCLWRLLKGSVCRAAKARDRRIPIQDSKKLYQHNPEGFARLERSVLALTTAWGGVQGTARGFLASICPDAVELMRHYPWYEIDGLNLPHRADGAAVRLGAEALKRDLSARGVRPAGLWAEVLPEFHYNRLVNQTRNKAVVLQGLVLRLMQRIADAYPNHDLQIVIDKQGGRTFYANALLKSFEDRRLKVIEESETSSTYELMKAPTRWNVRFVQSAESKHLPVALASMVAKYVRELLMTSFNAYWCGKVNNLKATAGYYQDGMRFIRDVRPHLARLGIREEQFVRLHSGAEKLERMTQANATTLRRHGRHVAVDERK